MPTVYVRNSGDSSGVEPTIGNPFGIGLTAVSFGEVRQNPTRQYYAQGQGLISESRVMAITQEQAEQLTLDQTDAQTVGGALSPPATIAIEVPPMWNMDP